MNTYSIMKGDKELATFQAADNYLAEDRAFPYTRKFKDAQIDIFILNKITNAWDCIGSLMCMASKAA